MFASRSAMSTVANQPGNQGEATAASMDIYHRIMRLRRATGDVDRAQQICHRRSVQSTSTSSKRESYPATYCRTRKAIEVRSTESGVDAVISFGADKYGNIPARDATSNSTTHSSASTSSATPNLLDFPTSCLREDSNTSNKKLVSKKSTRFLPTASGMTSDDCTSSLTISRVRKHRNIHKTSSSSCRQPLFAVLLMICLTGTSAMWWSPSSRSKLVDTSRLCQWARKTGGEADKMCRNDRQTVNEIGDGIDLGLKNCAIDLRYNRWNCSQAKKVYFGNVMRKDLRETAYVQALTAASVTYQLTLACTKGRVDCGCTEAARQQTRNILIKEAQKRHTTLTEEKLDELVDQFEWGGCGDNVDFGSRKAIQFMNINQRKKEAAKGNITEALYVHNFEAGLKTITNNMRNNCQCHGLSGSCTVWTCWPIMPRFVEVRQRLRFKYDHAVRVQAGADGVSLMRSRIRTRGRSRFPRHSAATNHLQSGFELARHRTKTRIHGGNRVRAIERKRRTARRVTPEDLVYLQSSPSYCAPNKSKGSLGTFGRRCDPNTAGQGSCSYLCCGRGYRTQVYTFTEKCNCRFVYCCELKCDECVRRENRHYCL